MRDIQSLVARGQALAPDECAELAQQAARLVELERYLKDDPHQRIYELLWRDEHSEGWLVSWWDARDTGYHDHDGSSGGIAVLAGRVTEEPLVVSGKAQIREYGAGDALSFSGTRIHRMHHDPEAVTIHVYSPPITRIGAYDVVDGVLTRSPGAPDDESPESLGLERALAGGR